VPRPGFADRSTIVQWLSSHKATGELPRLVRRMILESRAGLLEMSMPAGAGISAGDWDGTVRATAASPWVPEGDSGRFATVGVHVRAADCASMDNASNLGKRKAG
jgi:hypothetical protein